MTYKDRENSPECKTIEDALDAMGIPCHVEVDEGFLSLTFLGTDPIALEKSHGCVTVKIEVPPRGPTG